MCRPIVLVVLLSILAAPAAARAAAERPDWLDRAERSVARLRVPPRGDVEERVGTGLVAGFDGATLHLITAGHVIWPSGIPPASQSDKVDVVVELPAICGSTLPGTASPERLTPTDDLDLTVVTVVLSGDAAPEAIRVGCPGVLERVRELPAHVIDPRVETFRSGAQAWLVARGGTGGRDVLNVTLKAQVHGLIQLVKMQGVKPGNSGAPLFSERGHLIGMVVTDSAEAAAWSYGPILNRLLRWGDVPTGLAGEYTNLTFRQELKRPFVSIGGRPLEPLGFPHPSPRGAVPLLLQVEGRPEASGVVKVDGPSMVCKAAWVGTVEAWAVRHRRKTLGVALALAAATATAAFVANDAKYSFEESPSRAAYDRNKNANTVADVSLGLTLGAGLLSGYGYYNRNDRPGVTCQGEAR